MKELRWLREEPKSHVFFSFFLFFVSVFIYLFQVLCIINKWEQRPHGARAKAKKKTLHHFLSTPA